MQFTDACNNDDRFGSTKNTRMQCTFNPKIINCQHKERYIKYLPFSFSSKKKLKTFTAANSHVSIRECACACACSKRYQK